ncbi:hypothetical protein M5689_015287 [Euphorbia peplus]|nr:hypothetical protein M5689_015287 [Euphorbia peplus]
MSLSHPCSPRSYRLLKHEYRQDASPLLAAWKRGATQAPIVKIRGVIEFLQHTTLWNLATKHVVTHIKKLQAEFSHFIRKTTINFVVIKVQECQIGRQNNL